MSVWRRAALATGIVALVTALSFAQLPSAAVWSGLTPGDCAEYCENHHRCEPSTARPVVQQPLNAWSNLAYVLVGMVVLFAPNVTALSWLFGTSALLLGAGSFMFHATVTREMQWLDVVGMYAVLAALIAAGAARLWPVPQPLLMIGALALDGLLAYYKWQLNTWIMIPALAAMVGILMVQVGYRDRLSWREPALAAGLMSVALLVQRLDVHRVVCFPDSHLFQGHAVWHVLSAVVLFLVFRFFQPWPPNGGRGRKQELDRRPEWYREAA